MGDNYQEPWPDGRFDSWCHPSIPISSVGYVAPATHMTKQQPSGVRVMWTEVLLPKFSLLMYVRVKTIALYQEYRVLRVHGTSYFQGFYNSFRQRLFWLLQLCTV